MNGSSQVHLVLASFAKRFNEIITFSPTSDHINFDLSLISNMFYCGFYDFYERNFFSLMQDTLPVT